MLAAVMEGLLGYVDAEMLGVLEHALVVVLLLTVLLLLSRLQRARRDPAAYQLSIVDSIKANAGPARIFDSHHVYAAGAPSMDVDSLADGEVRARSGAAGRLCSAPQLALDWPRACRRWWRTGTGAAPSTGSRWAAAAPPAAAARSSATAA